MPGWWPNPGFLYVVASLERWDWLLPGRSATSTRVGIGEGIMRQRGCL